jgi:hypothetical protein
MGRAAFREDLSCVSEFLEKALLCESLTRALEREKGGGGGLQGHGPEKYKKKKESFECVIMDHLNAVEEEVDALEARLQNLVRRIRFFFLMYGIVEENKTMDTSSVVTDR